ncbi:MAG: hypothetical protein Q7K20_06515 [Polaromonas sp.]|nr:hypothetical protein [Polaromonas sp.]
MNESLQLYAVNMVGATGLSTDERSAAELRFSMALEFGVGGAECVLPTLQACMLARSLIEGLPTEERTDAECGAELEVIALWENAEDRAIMTALKPLNTSGDMDEVRFVISV